MATTTRSRTQKSRTRTELEQHAAELEALGLGIAPAADPPAVSPELVDEAVDRAAGRRRVREALGVPSDRRISNEVIDELLAGASTEEEIAGPGGLLAELTKRLVERAMEVELTDHVGYEPHLRAARRREQPAQRHDAEDADHRPREDPDRRRPRSRRQL